MKVGSIELEDVETVFTRFLNFPSDAFMDLVVSDSDRRNIKTERLRQSVLNFIRSEKTATTTEIADAFDIGIDEVMLILKKLEKEKKIRLK